MKATSLPELPKQVRDLTRKQTKDLEGLRNSEVDFSETEKLTSKKDLEGLRRTSLYGKCKNHIDGPQPQVSSLTIKRQSRDNQETIKRQSRDNQETIKRK